MIWSRFFPTIAAASPLPHLEALHRLSVLSIFHHPGMVSRLSFFLLFLLAFIAIARSRVPTNSSSSHYLPSTILSESRSVVIGFTRLRIPEVDKTTAKQCQNNSFCFFASHYTPSGTFTRFQVFPEVESKCGGNPFSGKFTYTFYERLHNNVVKGYLDLGTRQRCDDAIGIFRCSYDYCWCLLHKHKQPLFVHTCSLPCLPLSQVE